jgi:hypothetical protein
MLNVAEHWDLLELILDDDDHSQNDGQYEKYILFDQDTKYD